AHFQAEDGHDGIVVDRRVLSNVDGEGGFAHRRAGGDDDQFVLLQAAGHAVKLGEVGGQTGDFAALLIKVVNGAKRVLDDLVQRLKALRNALLGYFEQPAFSLVQHADGRLALVGGTGDGHRADAHQLAQQALVLDDPDVLFNHRLARQALRQGRKVGHSPHRLDFL